MRERKYMKYRGQKNVRMGKNCQLVIPEALSPYDDQTLPNDDNDKLVWNPIEEVDQDALDDFLKKAAKKSPLPMGGHVRDDEEALYFLQQSGHNMEMALGKIIETRRKYTPNNWTSKECSNFESGMLSYGKDFRLIQKKKLRGRTIHEVVQFYYFWKKTEMYDAFVIKYGLDRKKERLHPGSSIDLDKFLQKAKASSSKKPSSSSSFSSKRKITSDEVEEPEEETNIASTSGSFDAKRQTASDEVEGAEMKTNSSEVYDMFDQEVLDFLSNMPPTSDSSSIEGKITSDEAKEAETKTKEPEYDEMFYAEALAFLSNMPLTFDNSSIQREITSDEAKE